MNLKFLRWTRRETGRNCKFTALVRRIAELLFSKTVAAVAFALIAFLGLCDLLAGNASFAAAVIVAIAALGAVGFGFAAWADK